MFLTQIISGVLLLNLVSMVLLLQQADIEYGSTNRSKVCKSYMKKGPLQYSSSWESKQNGDMAKKGIANDQKE